MYWTLLPDEVIYYLSSNHRLFISLIIPLILFFGATPLVIGSRMIDWGYAILTTVGIGVSCYWAISFYTGFSIISTWAWVLLVVLSLLLTRLGKELCQLGKKILSFSPTEADFCRRWEYMKNGRKCYFLVKENDEQQTADKNKERLTVIPSSFLGECTELKKNRTSTSEKYTDFQRQRRASA